MITIDQIIDDILKAEGGYVNNPNDKGGETNWGITAATARANGYNLSMAGMPRGAAIDIYRKEYVIAPGFDKVITLSSPIAAELVDTGVNMGTNTATMFLQRSLNALTGVGLAVDGNLGPASLSALKDFLNKRGHQGEQVLLKALNSLQCARYIGLVEQNAKQRSFIYGWIANRVVI